MTEQHELTDIPYGWDHDKLQGRPSGKDDLDIYPFRSLFHSRRVNCPADILETCHIALDILSSKIIDSCTHSVWLHMYTSQ